MGERTAANYSSWLCLTQLPRVKVAPRSAARFDCFLRCDFVTHLANRGSSVAMQCATKSCSVGCGFFFNPKEGAKYRPARASLIFSHASALSKLADISHCASGAVELGALAVPGGSIKYQPMAIPAPSMRQHARCGLITLLTANFIARPYPALTLSLDHCSR